MDFQKSTSQDFYSVDGRETRAAIAHGALPRHHPGYGIGNGWITISPPNRALGVNILRFACLFPLGARSRG